MDLASTGSTISKTDIEETFKVSELRERKAELYTDGKKPEPKVEESTEEVQEKQQPEELTIDDFIEDFKL